MRSVSTKTSSKILLVFLLLALINCAAEKRYKILTVFFDGVPKPGEKKEQETSKAKTQDQGAQQVDQAQKDVIRMISRHPGYRDGKCNDCHDRSAANFLRTSRDTLPNSSPVVKSRSWGTFIPGWIGATARTISIWGSLLARPPSIPNTYP